MSDIPKDQYKYIWFKAGDRDPFPFGMSGIHTTRGKFPKPTPTGGYSNMIGYWCSSHSYGPDDRDWWRCNACGHTADIQLKACPACGEAQLHEHPQL